MTYINGVRGYTSKSNSNLSLSQVGFNKRINKLQSATSTTVTLDKNASSNDNEYKNDVIEIINGTGVGQQGLITNYIGDSKIATVLFPIIPDITSEYVIHVHSGKCPIQDQKDIFKTIKLADNEIEHDNFYNNCYIKLYNNIIDTVIVKIIHYNGKIKSLGAGGGDCILAAGPLDSKDYFSKKGFSTIFNYKEIF